MKKLIKNSGICILMTAATVLFADGEHKTRKNINLSELPPIPHGPRMPVKNNNQVDAFLKTQPKVLAQYKTDLITLESVNKSFKMGIQMQHVKMNHKQLKEKLTQYVSSKIEQRILVHKANESGFKPSTEKAEMEYKKLSNRYGGEKRFSQVLKMQGLEPDTFKHEMSENLAIRQYIEHQKKNLVITDKDLEIYYNNHKDQFTLPEKQIRASHIMAAYPPKATDEQKAAAKKKITTILAQLKQGKSFTELAKTISDCPSGQRTDGDIGFFTKNNPRMDPAFSKAAYALKIGEISDIVQSRFGYHIIKVTEVRKKGLATLDEAKDVITRQLRQQKMKEQVKATIDEEQNKGAIKYFIK